MSAEVATPRHGEERNKRIENEVRTDTFELEDGSACRVTYAAMTQTVSERWCETCQEWRRVEGVLGPLLGCHACGRPWR